MPGCGGDRLLRLASPGKGALGGCLLVTSSRLGKRSGDQELWGSSGTHTPPPLKAPRSHPRGGARAGAAEQPGGAGLSPPLPHSGQRISVSPRLGPGGGGRGSEDEAAGAESRSLPTREEVAGGRGGSGRLDKTHFLIGGGARGN